MVLYLRACFIFCCHNQMEIFLQGKIELSSVLERPSLGETKTSGDLSLATNLQQ